MAIDFELGNQAMDIIAFAIAFIYTLVPIAFFYQYSSGVIKPIRISIFGILFLYLNGLTYFIVTIKNGINGVDKIILRDFSNLSGAILGFCYSIYYLYLMQFKNHRQKFYIYLCLVIISLLVLILIALFISPKIYEYIGVAFNIFEYLPLGFDFFYLLKHKISDKYTLFSAIPGIINTIIWLVWAILKVINDGQKYHTLIANILGFLLCLTQFIIFFCFKKDEQISDPMLENEVKEEEDNLVKEIAKKEKQKSEYDEFL